MKIGHLRISELHLHRKRLTISQKLVKVVGNKIHKKKEYECRRTMDLSRLLPAAVEFQHEFWSGLMEWHQHQHHLRTNLKCTAWSTKPQFVGDIGPEWPIKIQLKLIPKVTTAAFMRMGITSLLKDNVAQVVLLKFDETGTADIDLMKLQMKYSCETSSPVFGLVQFGCSTQKMSRHHHHHHEDLENNDSDTDITYDCPIKFLLMIYVPVRDSFYGLIPANQDEFIENLLAAMKQQQAANTLLLLQETTRKF